MENKITIFDTIVEMKADFLRQTGKQATDIYAGKEEVREMVLEAEKYGVLLTAVNDIDTKTVLGLNLHKTRDETHLGLGMFV